MVETSARLVKVKLILDHVTWFLPSYLFLVSFKFRVKFKLLARPFQFQVESLNHDTMSFNPSMHSTPLAQQSFSLGSQSTFADVSEETAKKIASLQAKLNQKLGPEFISQRPGPGGGPKLTYAEGWKVINLANEVFGFNGWSSSIVSLNTDFIDFIEASGKYNVGVTAIVRVTLRDGTFHEDIGYGLLDNGRQKGAALDKVGSFYRILLLI